MSIFARHACFNNVGSTRDFLAQHGHTPHSRRADVRFSNSVSKYSILAAITSIFLAGAGEGRHARARHDADFSPHELHFTDGRRRFRLVALLGSILAGFLGQQNGATWADAVADAPGYYEAAGGRGHFISTMPRRRAVSLGLSFLATRLFCAHSRDASRAARRQSPIMGVVTLMRARRAGSDSRRRRRSLPRWRTLKMAEASEAPASADTVMADNAAEAARTQRSLLTSATTAAASAIAMLSQQR